MPGKISPPIENPFLSLRTDEANRINFAVSESSRTVTSGRPRDQFFGSTGAEEEQQVVFEPLSPQEYNLSYACLIIPRFNTHLIAGDLEEFLYQEVKRICISYGWKLEFVEIRPPHLQWIMVVPAATPPSSFMRVIRQQTSKNILSEFPRFRKENSSHDFWAPGYLVLVGMQPYPPEMIKEFIRQTRQQQGLPY